MKIAAKGLAFIFVLLVFLSVSCAQPEERTPNLSSKNYGLAPDFKLQDIRDNTVTLSGYKDKQPVILFFWTTWCPYCRKELRSLNNRYPDLVKDGWELLAVDIGEPAYKVDNFVKNYSLAFKVLLDRNTAIADSYGILGVPTYIIINKKGYIVFRDNYFPHKEYKELISE